MPLMMPNRVTRSLEAVAVALTRFRPPVAAGGKQLQHLFLERSLQEGLQEQALPGQCILPELVRFRPQLRPKAG
jgi:hypothetical protein